MLKTLEIENFTVFKKAQFQFSPGLNVIIGENGTGKSHVLKLVYSVIAENYHQGKRPPDPSTVETLLKRSYAEKLLNVFRSETLNNLIHKNPNLFKWLENSFQIFLTFHNPQLNCGLYSEVPSVSDITFDELITSVDVGVSQVPRQWPDSPPVFIPARELLTIYPGFVSLYESRRLEFDETYRDTCLFLGEPLLRRLPDDLLQPLENAMGGRVRLENGRFYLVSPQQGKIEMPLVAEGLRKLAMLAQLIATGALQKGSYLFWDEPETNLNPRLIKKIAAVIVQLASRGIQIFIATHSLFLLRELEIWQTRLEKPIGQHYFALKAENKGVLIEQGECVDDLQSLVLLDEELAQSDRFMDAQG